MTEAELQDKVLNRLRKQYGDERVVAEPSLKGKKTVYPDVAVFHTEERTTPFLLVECSSFRTAHRRDRDLNEITKAIGSTEAEFGALVSQNVEFIFSEGRSVYQTYAEFPDVNSDLAGETRPIQSQPELDFLVQQCLTAQESIRQTPRHEAEAIDELLESLHLLLEARRNGITISEASVQDLVPQLESSLSDRHHWYRGIGIQDYNPKNLSVVAALFNGFTLAETENRILESLFELTPDDKRGGTYSTPLEVARQMVRLTEPDTGEVVLDPAAGRGTALSLSAAEGAKGIGIEINVSVVSLATFYLDLFDRDVELHASDFFEMEAGSEQLPSSVDHIIVDPPFNANIEQEGIPFSDNRGHVHSQDAFLARGLSLLEEGGSIIIAVPAGFLHTRRSQWIRTTVLEEVQLESVIQIIDGPIYQHTSIDTAFITVTNKSPSPNHTVQYQIVESPEDPVDALADAVSAIHEGTANSLSQSELDDSLNIRRLTQQETVRKALEEEFSKVVDLPSVADIRTGARPDGVLEEEYDDTIPYFSIRDATGQSPRHENRYIPRDVATTVADPSSVLLSTIGSEVVTHIPSEPIAPMHNWAVLDFESLDEARVYETFLNSDWGVQQLDALKSGTSVSRVNISDLHEFLVPKFTELEIDQRATEIKNHQQKLKELDQERKRLARERDELAGDVNDLLSGGDQDE